VRSQTSIELQSVVSRGLKSHVDLSGRALLKGIHLALLAKSKLAWILPGFTFHHSLLYSSFPVCRCRVLLRSKLVSGLSRCPLRLSFHLRLILLLFCFPQHFLMAVLLWIRRLQIWPQLQPPRRQASHLLAYCLPPLPRVCAGAQRRF